MRKNVVLITSLFLSAGIMFNACKHEAQVSPISGTIVSDTTGIGGNGGGTTMNHPCDSDSVYFVNDILPIFLTNCAMSGCHNSGSHKDGKILDSYSNIISTGNIEAFNVNHGKIYKSITNTDLGDRMPPPPSLTLTQQQINMIALWINQGALNNSCDDCDTSNVTYAGTIAPLLQLKCVGCHNGTVASGNVNLSTYSGAQSVASNGKLFGSVHHDAGFPAMPPGGTFLPDCEIAQIRIWIQQGAPNN